MSISMRRLLRSSAIGSLCLVSMSTPALAEKYLPLQSVVTGRELARIYRTDGAAPSLLEYTADQKTCGATAWRDDEPRMRKILELYRRDQDAGQVARIAALSICMGKSGWRVIESAATESASAPITKNLADRRKYRAAADIAFDKLSATLPQAMDDYSDLVAVKRVGDELIYAVRVRPSEQAVADEARRLMAADPHGFSVGLRSMMKQRVCEPKPNAFLTWGFAVIYEYFDGKGLVTRERVTLADCP